MPSMPRRMENADANGGVTVTDLNNMTVDRVICERDLNGN